VDALTSKAWVKRATARNGPKKRYSTSRAPHVAHQRQKRAGVSSIKDNSHKSQRVVIHKSVTSAQAVCV
jgi:hypothetical protein